MKKSNADAIEERLIQEISHHLAGLREKILQDFSHESFHSELAALRGDPVYADLHFDCKEYVFIRLMGRVSISIGRRLGEIYDKIPRFVAASRFGLSTSEVAWSIEGLNLDVGIDTKLLNPGDRAHAESVMRKYLRKQDAYTAMGIEIRYNFNPNDSARLRKDVAMANGLKKIEATPVYLVFSSISPRDEAIERLKRAGWQFLIGDAAYNFMQDLFEVDLPGILKQETVSVKIQREVESIMRELLKSDAFTIATT